MDGRQSQWDGGWSRHWILHRRRPAGLCDHAPGVPKADAGDHAHAVFVGCDGDLRIQRSAQCGSPSGAAAAVSEGGSAAHAGGEELSEDFKAKASTIFEAAVSSKIKQIEDTLQEEHEKSLKEAKEDMVDKVDSYLNYVTEEWKKELEKQF